MISTPQPALTLFRCPCDRTIDPKIKNHMPLSTIGAPQLKQHDIFVTVYEPKATIYTDQTDQFSPRSSHGNKYQMLRHNVNSNSTWVEPMKNKTEGAMILARCRALTRMKHQGIEPKHRS